MLEKIGTKPYRHISQPASDALMVLDRVLATTPEPTVAEIGVGVGATTIELVRRMKNRGKLLLFDFEDRVRELETELKAAGFTNIEALGNTRLTYDSYCWNLAKIALDRRARGDGPLLDFAFLDGAHNFINDAPAALILKSLLKPGGYLLFDDLLWTYDSSPSMANNPTVRLWFTQEQAAAAQVKIVCDLFFENDPDFTKETFGGKISRRRALYRKMPTTPAQS